MRFIYALPFVGLAACTTSYGDGPATTELVQIANIGLAMDHCPNHVGGFSDRQALTAQAIALRDRAIALGVTENQVARVGAMRDIEFTNQQLWIGEQEACSQLMNLILLG